MEDVVVVDSENENVRDNVNVVEDDTVGDNALIAPKVGMPFENEKEVYEFYARYAYDVGFPIRKRSSMKDDDGVLRFITLRCSRKGRRNGSGNTSTSFKPYPTIQTGCKARISASLDIHGFWKINMVHLDHNHKTSPIKSRLYRCNQELSAHVKLKLEVIDQVGIPLHKSFTSAVVEAGGYENMTCVKNDFGLISNENTDTFVWLFQTWLKCMHGQALHGIITYQDRAMQNAIEIVFPKSRHIWCLWHILKKLPEKFGYHVDKLSIFHDIHVLVYDSQFVEEFEEGWRLMINRYDLRDNDWLSGLYENRARWVPCFLKITFWAGMSTTQRSESMNAFFDDYVHSKTSLKQFVEQYEQALRSKVEKEFQADFKSFSEMLPCATTYPMEKQYQALYTISKYKEVQVEFTRKVYYDLMSASEGHMGTTYDVVCGERRKKKTFIVSFNKETCEFICCCHLFEFRGIVCRNAIAMLIRNDVNVMPEQYILRRWRRDVTRAHTRVAVTYNDLVSTPAQQRYEEMCQAFAAVADLTADDIRKHRVVMDWIHRQQKELSLDQKELSVDTPGINDVSQSTTPENVGRNGLKDLICMTRKGAPRTKQRKGPLEANAKKSRVRSNKNKGQSPTPMHKNIAEGLPELSQPPQQKNFMPMPFSYTQLLQGAGMSQLLTQEESSSTFIPTTSARNVISNSQGSANSYYYEEIPHHGGSI